MTDTPETPLTLLTEFAPVPVRERRDGWQEQVQRTFIAALADCGSVEAACRYVGRSPASAYRLRRHPEGGEFARAWQLAVDLAVQQIEDAAMDRALNGVEVPVFAYGNQLATRRVHNESLVMFMLRSRAPERYCDGGAKGLNAVDKRMLDRLKKQWRKEWEAERRLLDEEEDKETLESLDQWIDTMAQNRWNNMSPRARAAFEEAERIRQEDGVAWMDAEIAAEEDDGEIRVPLPAWRKQEPEEEEPDEGPQVRTLKDDGW